MTLLLSEEWAYWDRGVMGANPGPGLPEGNVLALGTDAQKEQYLGPFLDPDRPRWACFAMTEPGAGSDAAAIRWESVCAAQRHKADSRLRSGDRFALL